MRALRLSLLLLPAALTACQPDMETIRQITGHEDVSVQEGKNAELYYSEEGQVRAKLLAATLRRSDGAMEGKETYTEMPDGLKVYFYNDSLELQSQLSADYGIGYDERRSMTVRGNVLVVNMDGEKLTGEELTWDQEQHKIYSTKFVTITTPDEIIYGEGFESDETFSDYTITHIRGSINLKEDEDF